MSIFQVYEILSVTNIVDSKKLNTRLSHSRENNKCILYHHRMDLNFVQFKLVQTISLKLIKYYINNKLFTIDNLTSRCCENLYKIQINKI